MDDTFKTSRDCLYDRQVKSMLSNDISPLKLLLRQCDHNEVEVRRRCLLKIFQAAGKLSIQLWAQDATVELYHDLQSEQSPCYTYDSQMTEANPLMRVFAENQSLEEQKVELVVRPGIKLHRLDTKDGRRDTLIAAKASVMVFLGEWWKDNQQRHNEDKAYAIDPASVAQSVTQRSYLSAMEARQERETKGAELKRAAESITAKLLNLFKEKSDEPVPESDSEVCPLLTPQVLHSCLNECRSPMLTGMLQDKRAPDEPCPNNPQASPSRATRGQCLIVQTPSRSMLHEARVAQSKARRHTRTPAQVPRARIPLLSSTAIASSRGIRASARAPKKLPGEEKVRAAIAHNCPSKKSHLTRS